MKNEIQKYEPMMMVTMKDGRVLFYPQLKDQFFYENLKTETFVNIEGIRVNKFEIKYIEPMPKYLDILATLDEDLRKRAIERFDRYKATLGKWPDKKTRIHLVQKLIEKDRQVQN